MFYILTLLFIFLLFLFNPIVCRNATSSSFHLWLYNYVPSVFIYLILTDLITESKFFNKIINNIVKNNHPYFIKSFIISLISGIIPASNNLQKVSSEPKYTLFYILSCNILNPAFILIYANIYLKNSWICLGILLLNILFNSILFFFILKKDKSVIIQEDINEEEKSFLPSLLNSLEKNFLNLVKLLGVIIFVTLFSELLITYSTKIPYLKYPIIILASNLEIIHGLELISNHFTGLLKNILSIFSLSFLGFSIHIQSIFLIKKNISYFPIFIYNFFKALIITLIFCTILL